MLRFAWAERQSIIGDQAYELRAREGAPTCAACFGGELCCLESPRAAHIANRCAAHSFDGSDTRRPDPGRADGVEQTAGTWDWERICDGSAAVPGSPFPSRRPKSQRGTWPLSSVRFLDHQSLFE